MRLQETGLKSSAQKRVAICSLSLGFVTTGMGVERQFRNCPRRKREVDLGSGQVMEPGILKFFSSSSFYPKLQAGVFKRL